MKLKEKLAEEYLTPQLDNLYPKADTGVVATMKEQHLIAGKLLWLAGFEKAREMAAEHFKSSWTNLKYQGFTMKQGLELVADDTEKLGEEEV